jgi:L-lactate dehydrogenase complex protein LldF
MTDPFQYRIREAQKNPVLQAALDANAERRVRVRKEAFASLPDYQGLRSRAHHIRADVIANLDRYLEQFVDKVQVNGWVVHRAADGEQASQIVLEIARQNSVELVAKSKTMVSEEIHLNKVLEEAGLRPVETDLGEYIVQLRGEPPAHIITPAVHLRRKEVGETFHELLGIPMTEDIPTMTAAAREKLRDVFLQAGMGLSGVNFGVAETGTVCVLTNEGNGRMVTTLPKVHVALMGIERLVPNLSDLGLMLALLPRSATGQKITVYTSLIQGPAQPGDSDGPAARHLVLVDNGRRALRDSPLSEMLFCIRCGACLNACPVFREIGGHGYISNQGLGSPYPGPMGAVLSPALFGASEFGHLARASSLCGACKEACPVDIDLPKLLLRIRAGLTESNSRSQTGLFPYQSNAPVYLKHALRLFRWAASRPPFFTLVIRVSGIASRLIPSKDNWLKLPAVTGWGYSKDFPKPASRPFRTRWNDWQVHSGVVDAPEITSYSPGLEQPVGEFPGEDRFEEGISTAFTPTAQPLPQKPGAWDPSVPVDGLQGRTTLQQDPSPATLVALFEAELVGLGGKFIRCMSSELPERLALLIEELRADRVMAWEQASLPPGLLDRLKENGVTPVHDPDPAIKAGITGVVMGVAETGSLLITSGAGKPLTTSLLPEVHIALLPVGSIKRTLAEALEAGGPDIVRAAAAVFISGPSRTADIEMTLTIGVHGPKELYVFCYEEG